MWWSRKARLAAALGMAVLPAACGFAPMYGGSAAVEANYAAIEISNIPDRDGQYLRNLLIDRLYTRGRPADARYELKIEPLKTVATDLGIQKDATVTRTEIEIDARMALVEKATGKTVLERALHAVSGYDVLDEQYATLVTRQDVKDHVLGELADDVTTALNLYFRGEK